MILARAPYVAEGLEQHLGRRAEQRGEGEQDVVDRQEVVGQVRSDRVGALESLTAARGQLRRRAADGARQRAERRCAASSAPAVASTPAWARSGPAIPSGWARIAESRCCWVTSACPAAVACCRAALNASLVLVVHRFGSSVIATLASGRARAPRPGAAGPGHAGRCGASLRRGARWTPASASSSLAQRLELALELEDPPHALEVVALARQLLDAAQLRDVAVREPSATRPASATGRRARCARSCAASGGACPRGAAATEIT